MVNYADHVALGDGREVDILSITAPQMLTSLEARVVDGSLAAVCVEYGVEILTLFGSAVSCDDPGDIDLAVGFAPGRRDFLAVVNALSELIPGDHLDVMDLDRADPVAQMAAMFGNRVLFEAHRSVTTERAIRAFMGYEDTRWLRALQTEVLLG